MGFLRLFVTFNRIKISFICSFFVRFWRNSGTLCSFVFMRVWVEDFQLSKVHVWEDKRNFMFPFCRNRKCEEDESHFPILRLTAFYILCENGFFLLFPFVVLPIFLKVMNGNYRFSSLNIIVCLCRTDLNNSNEMLLSSSLRFKSAISNNKLNFHNFVAYFFLLKKRIFPISVAWCPLNVYFQFVSKSYDLQWFLMKFHCFYGFFCVCIFLCFHAIFWTSKI